MGEMALRGPLLIMWRVASVVAESNYRQREYYNLSRIGLGHIMPMPSVIQRSQSNEVGVASEDFRVERDSLGELKVPAGALWGAQTQRAVENFPISGLRMPRDFIRALGLIKWAAATTNLELDA